jgi:hypothetical protein
MSHNIRGFQDINNNERTRLNANRAGMSLFYANPQDQENQNSKDPRSETFLYALRINFCSTLRLKSFVAIFIFFSIFFFILQRIIDGIQIPGELLQAKASGKYTSALGLSIEKLHSGQLWRLLTVFMGFLNLSQWVSLTIISLFFVTMVESVHGLKRCLGESAFAM